MPKGLMVIIALFIAPFFITACGTGDVDTETAQTNLSNNTAIETTSEPENAHIVQIGETLQFGGYDWRVLDIEDSYALIITETIIFNRLYHNEPGSVTWETSRIRQLLNDNFYNSFSYEDRARIRETMLINNDNPWYETSGGNNTNDKIFLLSVEDTVKYFGDSGKLQNRPPYQESVLGMTQAWQISDAYNYNRIALDSDGEARWWWLRSPGYHSYNTSLSRYTYRFIVVFPNGSIQMEGFDTISFGGGVRPALWLRV